MKYRAISVVVIVLMVISGCAKRADQITTQYVSPLSYDSYNCEQVLEETSRLDSKLTEVTKQVNNRAYLDLMQFSVGVLLFWPALLVLGDDDAQNAELARLKGENEAIEKSAVAKNCVRFEVLDEVNRS